MIGFSLRLIFQVRLPNGNNQNSLINLNIHIRDKSDCIKESNLSSVYVYDDSTEIENFFSNFKNSKTVLTGNQNDVLQIVILISEKLNKMTNNI